MLIILTIGDWSMDGHGKSDDFIFESSHCIKEIASAYKKGVKICGVDITNLCYDYEDNTLSKEDVDKLKATFPQSIYDTFEIEEPSKYRDFYSIWIDGFVQIYTAIVKLGNPEITLECRILPAINIGGYGLYC